MKSLLVTCLFFLSVSFILAQEAVQEPKFVYCEVLGTSRMFSRKVTVTVDFGEKMQLFADNRMKDPKTGKAMVFNSMVDALNYMGKRGWEMMQAYPVTIGQQNVYHFLLQKPFNELDQEAKDAIMSDKP